MITLRAFPAVVVVLVSSAALAVICPPQWQPWIQFGVATLVAGTVTVRRRGRPLSVRGPRSRRLPVDVVDLVSPDFSLVGCVEGHRVVTTGVEISAGALLTTEVGRDDPADFRGVRLPLSAVARQLDQGGVSLEGIDVVVHGRRAASGPDGDVYGSLVGPLPLISHRRVHLLLRFDVSELALACQDGAGRGSLASLITGATERLRRSLVHHGVPCRVFDATELAERFLEAEVEPTEGTAFVVRPGAGPREVVDALTSVRASAITEVLRLRRVPGRHDVVDTVSSVWLAGLTPGALPPCADSCHPLPTPRVLPIPGEELPDAVAGSLVRRRLDHLDELAPPAHGCGQILGATRAGDAAAVQLAGPHLRSVLLAAGSAVCRQVAFRAVAAGYRVAVVTDVPDRWRSLSAIADETRYRIVAADASDVGTPVDAVFWDVGGALSEGRIDALAGPGGPDVTPPTVIRVDADWDLSSTGGATTSNPPDLVLDGRIPGWISVEPRSGPTRRVSVVTGPGEDAFVGTVPGPGQSQASADLTPAGAEPSASPDRR
ncbi:MULTISPECIES: type VII secretion protein EccE [unclassified Dietzia]|uniref:type VII secretion protein EccE n=2 Tax=Dietzia TaxID=37914 RepID=UPI0015FC07FE|nr:MULTISPECIES: type VII secretion protein EccE [unclassified Dietzia]MBB1026058.1 hypothetical protein [Dietzia sp. DQ12-76]MBB1028208.1 hypothetical protein [Dietzia sp. DQ11-38-2]